MHHPDLNELTDMSKEQVNKLTSADKLAIMVDFLVEARAYTDNGGAGQDCVWIGGTLVVAAYDNYRHETSIKTYKKQNLLRWFGRAKRYRNDCLRDGGDPYDLPWSEALSEEEFPRTKARPTGEWDEYDRAIKLGWKWDGSKWSPPSVEHGHD